MSAIVLEHIAEAMHGARISKLP